MLQKEKEKADKKIVETQSKAQEIIQRKNENDKLYEKKLKEQEKQKKKKMAEIKKSKEAKDLK